MVIKNNTIIPLHYSISPLNETALLITFEHTIDETINKKVIALQKAFEKIRFNGFIETVPAYSSLAVFYDVLAIKKNNPLFSTAFEYVKKITEQLVNETQTETTGPDKIVTIPVYYNGADLDYVAAQHQLTVEKVVNIHTAKVYRVYMIGFLPGFAYMGKADERIATPRLASPRTNVQPGSVGIAGFQTGIYPLQSPGGWQLIGQTPLKIFDPQKNEPCLLRAGDTVQFIAIGKEEFERSNEY